MMFMLNHTGNDNTMNQPRPAVKREEMSDVHVNPMNKTAISPPDPDTDNVYEAFGKWNDKMTDYLLILFYHCITLFNLTVCFCILPDDPTYEN